MAVLIRGYVSLRRGIWLRARAALDRQPKHARRLRHQTRKETVQDQQPPPRRRVVYAECRGVIWGILWFFSTNPHQMIRSSSACSRFRMSTARVVRWPGAKFPIERPQIINQRHPGAVFANLPIFVTVKMGFLSTTGGLKGRALRWAITACSCQAFLLLGFDQGVMSGLIGADNQFGRDFNSPDANTQGIITSIYGEAKH